MKKAFNSRYLRLLACLALSALASCLGCSTHTVIRMNDSVKLFGHSAPEGRMLILKTFAALGEDSLRQLVARLDMQDEERSFIEDNWKRMGPLDLHIDYSRHRGIEILKKIELQALHYRLLEEEGGHPLVLASKRGFRTAAEVCIALGADVNVQGEFYQTPLHNAKNAEIASVLLASGAGINALDISGNTPLHDAVLHGRQDVVKFLLEHGADVNTSTWRYGESPLHTSVLVKKKNLEVVKLLLDYGADVNAPSSGGSTALSYANELGHIDIELLLIRYGAKLPDN